MDDNLPLRKHWLKILKSINHWKTFPFNVTIIFLFLKYIWSIDIWNYLGRLELTEILLWGMDIYQQVFRLTIKDNLGI